MRYNFLSPSLFLCINIFIGNIHVQVCIEPITRQHIVDSSKLKELADDNFKFDENGRNLSKRVENTVGKG